MGMDHVDRSIRTSTLRDSTCSMFIMFMMFLSAKTVRAAKESRFKSHLKC